MANLEINERDAQRLREIARRENRTVEEVIAEMLDRYSAHQRTTAGPNTQRTPYLSKLYAHARAYWRSTNDTARLSLTDEQLDEQFWCIDPDGIPRLKSDQHEVTVPENDLLPFLQSVWQENATGEIEEPINYREVLNRDFPDHLLRRMKGIDGQSSTD